MSKVPAWEGRSDRECGEHRTVGLRAWCLADSEWCSPKVLCRGCGLAALLARLRESWDEVVELIRRWAEEGR